jgi:hypothetical protein
MMEDTANAAEIVALFSAAGTPVHHETFERADEVTHFVNTHLQLSHSVGVAYTRPNRTGHMVVLRKMFGALECLDYQACFTDRYQPFPPEPFILQYLVFYIP